MSYFARQPKSNRLRLTFATVAIASVVAACGGSDASEDPPPAIESTIESASDDASDVELVDPDGFGAALAADPDMPLINVHIPYEDHIDGTDAFIAFDAILESADLPTDKTAPIALYCRSGNMSGQASAALLDAGYTNVFDLDGGMNAWEAAGNELIDDPSVALP